MGRVVAPLSAESPTASDVTTILVADDSADTREFLTAALVSEGYLVTTADNGADALELMRASPPHAVLLDLMMPILDGWKVLAECARHPDLRHIPVICMSALSGVDVRVRARGAAAFVPKPIDLSELLTALREFASPPMAPPQARARVVVDEATSRIRSAVRESEHLYRTLMEQAWDGILLFDADLNCLWANARAADVFGYELEQLCQVNYHDLIVTHPGDALLETPRCERQCRRLDGSTFTGEVSVRKIDSWRTQVLIRDVTKAKQLEEELRQSQKMEAMGKLAGGIAHDFNNVLTVIMGLSEFVLETVGPDHAVTQDLRDINAAGRRAAGLTQQLLAFSRKQVLDIRSMDVSNQIAQFSAMLRRILPENIELRVNLDATLTTIDADPAQVDQLLLNLAVNAKAAMPDGGTLSLSTRNTNGTATVPGQRIMITVADTGDGMDEETQRRMFEPFFTTKPAGQGTGLGLAMVYGIVQQLGGTIAVESWVGKGTTFHVTFPCTECEIVAADRSPFHFEAAAGDGTLLVVEDEASVRGFLAKALEHMGYRVLVADGPRAALQLMREQADHIDLIITDVMMPDMTGPDLIRNVSSVSSRSSVLYISGYMTDPQALGVGVAGIDYLAKPFTLEQLSAKVCALVEWRRQGQPSS